MKSSAWFKESSLTRPLKMEVPLMTLILFRSSYMRWHDRGFVKRSASWYCVLTWWTWSVPFYTMSLTKCKSIWMCFILECWIWLKVKCVAPKLSHKSFREAEMEKSSLAKSARSHSVLEAAFASAILSFSWRSRDSPLFFWTPRNRIRTKKTYVCRSRFLIVKLPTQSTSEYVVSMEGELLRMWIPWKMVCFKYRSNRFAADQWVVVGLCMNWDNLFTTKKMLKCVRDKYCKTPMTVLNFVLSIEDVPSSSLSAVLIHSEVVTSFTSCMLIFVNKSQIYLCWDKKRPVIMGITSIPKKKI